MVLSGGSGRIEFQEIKQLNKFRQQETRFCVINAKVTLNSDFLPLVLLLSLSHPPRPRLK